VQQITIMDAASLPPRAQITIIMTLLTGQVGGVSDRSRCRGFQFLLRRGVCRPLLFSSTSCVCTNCMPIAAASRSPPGWQQAGLELEWIHRPPSGLFGYSQNTWIGWDWKKMRRCLTYLGFKPIQSHSIHMD
jgi:hypothetical protein